MTVVAFLSVAPSTDESMAPEVAKAVAALDDFDVSYETTPMGTTIEADDIGEIFAAAQAAHEAVDGDRVGTFLKIDDKRTADTDAEAKVAGVKDEQDLPAQVSVQKVEAPNSVRAGRTVPVSTTITNVGDKEAESVVVTATFYQNGTTQQEQAVEIGLLEGGESHEESWPGVADIDRVLVAVDSANGSSDTSETTVLVTKTGSDPSVIDYAAPNGTIQLQGLRRAVADWRTDVISKGLLEEIVDAWRTRREVT